MEFTFDGAMALLADARKKLGYLYAESSVTEVSVEFNEGRLDVVVGVETAERIDDLRTSLPRQIEFDGNSVLVRIERRSRARPHFHPGGSAAGAGLTGYGTAGWNVALLDSTGLHVVALSNWHVLCAQGNATPIHTPVLLDGLQLARLYTFQPLQTHGNVWDYALAEYNDPANAGDTFRPCPDGSVRPYPMTLTKPTDLKPGDSVSKVGARPPICRKGTFTGVCDIAVAYPDGTRWFVGQLSFTKMTDGGDSGCIIVHEATTSATGLNFAGNSTSSFSNPLLNIGWQTIGELNSSLGRFPLFATADSAFLAATRVDTASSFPSAMSVARTLPTFAIPGLLFIRIATAELARELPGGGKKVHPTPVWIVPPPPPVRADATGPVAVAVIFHREYYDGVPGDVRTLAEYLCFG